MKLRLLPPLLLKYNCVKCWRRFLTPSGLDGDGRLARDLPESRTVQGHHHPSGPAPLWGEKLGPGQRRASCDHTETKMDRVVQYYVHQEVFQSHWSPYSVLSQPVIFGLGQHNPRSFHANVDAIQAEGERVGELDRCHHLFIDFSWTRDLKNTHDTNCRKVKARW